MPRPRKTQKTKRRIAAPRLRPRMKMGDAMRARGLDEHKLTTKLNGLLKSKNEKMLFEVVKECGKFLEAYPAPRSGAAQDSMPVQFISSVPRPARGESPGPAPDPAAAQTSVESEIQTFRVSQPVPERQDTEAQ